MSPPQEKKNPNGSTKKRGFNNTFVLLLLTSVVAHGILFSSNSIQSTQKQYFAQQREQNYKTAIVSSGDEDFEEDTDSGPYIPPQRLRSSISQLQHETQQLPHWRLATDCSSYNLECFAIARREYKYLPYPFSLSMREAVEKNAEGISGEWAMETVEKLPGEWIDFLEKEKNDIDIPVEERNYLYPPTVPEDEYQRCIDLAITQNKSTIEQLDVLLSGDSPRITPEPDTNMVAFTISDYGYVRDMLHDVFQMMDDIVGFSNKHFFLVAIDKKSVEIACKYGYSVVLWKADDNNLRDAVANTKLILSHDLTKRGVDFFFTEMDVWWIRSPKPNLIDFQKRHDHADNDQNDNAEKHVYFSGHQNNFNAPNIGVYAVKANKYSEEYFRVSLDVLNERPETHDQHVMAEVHRLFQHTYDKRPYKLGGHFKPDPPETPTIEHPFKALYFSPHEVVADERPHATQLTLAIHTLNGRPLQAPHGKKMNAKELGVYYGFHSHPQTTDESTDNGMDLAGYYERTDTHRRYLWLDTDIRTNFYSIAHPNRYHNKEVFEWTMAIMIAIARKTNRIFVLPQVFDADMDAGVYYSWTMMDYSKVEDMVDFRETNFLTNPKSWNMENSIDWPFETVATTAFFQRGDNDKIPSIYTQVSSESSIVYKKAWTANPQSNMHSWLDIWVGSFSAVPEVDFAEVLMVNPDTFMDKNWIWRFIHRLMRWKREMGETEETEEVSIGRMEQEILEIYDLLGWCWDRAFAHTANKVSASDSCYGKGQKRKYNI
eukprot:CAMPEP_0116121380 /NCGR_PEP_ID=MMETSP0329-20121206/3665_1 /TAXON_ID=697910 /ORGANISM="Pseudo-nitzschia arenysensis, Strain B593" /LENGTH=769 /DNA_ID=CAMNT_0003615187 /DNA_START=33 /DNA_END=2342 /DNA_ORIENTATION=-